MNKELVSTPFVVKASLRQLIVLVNLESMNAELIKLGMDRADTQSKEYDVSSTGSTISFDIEGQQKEFRITPDIKSTKSSVNLRMMLAGKKTFGYEND
ncbi:MAG: hypothetical protein KBS55_03635 [Bacteroidales bacterium]|nr:hypothetical protein [Candidatus Cryptobacteroides aphodequi]